MKKVIILLTLLSIFCVKAQNEFITLWEPDIVSTPTLQVDAPFQAGPNQIWFPGTGQNYTISWEEVGFPQHNGTMTNVTSTGQILIDFGTPVKEGSGATYRVKVSNGNGVFQKIKFANYQPLGNENIIVPVFQMQGSADKLLKIEQWGNINWTDMSGAFANCQRVIITATDYPNLSNVNSTSLMFYRAINLTSANFPGWDTSHIQNFSFMFDVRHISQTYNPNPVEAFNPPLNSWNMSSATDLSYMFAGRSIFNQNISSWDVSNVKKMDWMFGICSSFNQPLNTWNTEKVEDTHYMFFLAEDFNQPLDNWDVSQVTNMNQMFANAAAFNQPLGMWDVGNVSKMNFTFSYAASFNQSLGDWNIANVTTMTGMINNTALDCENYSRTLAGWADNPDTPNSLSLIAVNLQYASNVINKRNILISKNWTITGDSVGSCVLATRESEASEKPAIFPNPAKDFVYIKNLGTRNSFSITDSSGRKVMQGITNAEEKIDIRDLIYGHYILQIKTKEKIYSFKLIKH